MLIFLLLFFTVALNFEDQMVIFAASMADMAKINWIELNFQYCSFYIQQLTQLIDLKQTNNWDYVDKTLLLTDLTWTHKRYKEDVLQTQSRKLG